MGTSAKVLTAADVRRVLHHVARHRNANRNRTIVLLSFKAGLRACEIAGLDWSMVLQPNGKLGDQIAIASHIAKNGSGRRVPMHPDLKAALNVLNREQDRILYGPVIRSARGGHMTPRSIVNWFATIYAQLGLNGCSSHSGRRTFITATARLLTKIGGSLRDVQELAGHRALTTTERYIEGDRDAQRRLVRML
jgi:Site-specific recombinase XerC